MNSFMLSFIKQKILISAKVSFCRLLLLLFTINTAIPRCQATPRSGNNTELLFLIKLKLHERETDNVVNKQQQNPRFQVQML